MLEKLRDEFVNPDDEFSPVPFWFWNGDLREEEIKRQIRDFRSKGVMGFVLHPRMGIPHEIAYLSDRFMKLVRCAVEEAAALGMKVILYDEGMYPSGSAHGMVVKGNPEYASRGLKMIEISCRNVIPHDGKDCLPGRNTGFAIPELYEGENLVSVLAIEKVSDTEILPESTIKLKIDGREVKFQAPKAGNWSLLFFVETWSKGTIRGIHFGEDDNEPGAPPSGDLLNKAAMEKFIRLTHECYYTHLKEHFGKTVTAMFTDEPSMLGRCSISGLIPWTSGFLEWYLNCGNSELDLPVLWFNAGAGTEEKRRNYRKAVMDRLAESYYKPIARWCEEHGIALAGHPESSEDIGLLKHFHIPGQDTVWRFVAPGNGTSLSGGHSTLGKCSSDAARHTGRRRNANECFGCCGPDNVHWAFTAADMKWYLDWLFARGVNLIIPHAFYYSVEGPKRYGERPPDVGPNNIWWKYYQTISTYIKRMCWLLTDSRNVTNLAVLCGEDSLPWAVAKPLYRNQIEFNYLECELLCSQACRIENGAIAIERQKYHVVVVEDPGLLTGAVQEKLQDFIQYGGKVILHNKGTKACDLEGIIEITELDNIVETISGKAARDVLFNPQCDDLRISHLVKNSMHFYLLVNEGEESVEGELQLSIYGALEKWNAWKGTMEAADVKRSGNGMCTSISLEPRESLILCVDTDGMPDHEVIHKTPSIFESVDIHAEWLVSGLPGNSSFRTDTLESWTKWNSMEHYSGTLIYETAFEFYGSGEAEAVELDLGMVGEIAHVYVNGMDAGFKLWRPFRFDIKSFLHEGFNTLKAEVTNSLANKIEKTAIDSGLLGPVRIRTAR